MAADDEKFASDVKTLKTLCELLEALRTRRKEIKVQLGKDQRDEDESRLATELKDVSRSIEKLDVRRRALVAQFGTMKLRATAE